MEIKQKISIHNRFDIEVVNAKTGKVRQKAQAENIILDRLWTTLIENNSYSYFQYIQFGSGSGTPDHTDTALFNFEGAKITPAPGTTATTANRDITFSCDRTNGVASCQMKVQLSEQEYIGVTLTEVGIGYGSASDTLCTHAMLQDMNGNPISIEKTNTDIINIYATVYAHYTQRDLFYLDRGPTSEYHRYDGFRGWIFGLAKSSAHNLDYIMPTHIALAKDGLDVYTGANTVNRSYCDAYRDFTGVSYSADAANKRGTFTVNRFAVAEANMGGIGSIWFKAYGAYALRLPTSAFYSGDNITGEAVGTGDGSTTHFATKFDYPENAKVYVNGNQVSGVTVRHIPCNTLNLKQAYVKYLLPESTDALNLENPIAEDNSYGYNYRDKYKILAGRTIRNMINGIGFASVRTDTSGDDKRVKIYGSNDLSTWDLLLDRNDTQEVALDSTTGHYKYYKCVAVGDDPKGAIFTWNTDDFKAIVFDTAPANGDVITADYHTPYIAKDSDHVFDLTYTIQFGEYSE